MSCPMWGIINEPSTIKHFACSGNNNVQCSSFSQHARTFLKTQISPVLGFNHESSFHPSLEPGISTVCFLLLLYRASGLDSFLCSDVHVPHLSMLPCLTIYPWRPDRKPQFWSHQWIQGPASQEPDRSQLDSTACHSTTQRNLIGVPQEMEQQIQKVSKY